MIVLKPSRWRTYPKPSPYAALCLALALASSSANAGKPDPEKLDRARQGYLSPAEFRARYPAPPLLDEAVTAFSQAHRYLIDRSIKGFSADVVLVAPDGTMGYGTDYYLGGARRRLREIRPGHEAIAIDATVCRRTLSAPAWQCDPHTDGFYLGLPKIYRDAILDVEHGRLLCKTGICDAYRIKQAYTLANDGVAITAVPETYFHIYTLTRDQDGKPIVFAERYSTTWQRTMPDATYVFDFDTPIEPFDLPSE